MTRKVLDKELQELDAQIIELGSLVDEALGKALFQLAQRLRALDVLVVLLEVVTDLVELPDRHVFQRPDVLGERLADAEGEVGGADLQLRVGGALGVQRRQLIAEHFLQAIHEPAVDAVPARADRTSGRESFGKF